jgi:hypothetical protein
MSYLAPSTSSLQSTERIGQVPMAEVRPRLPLCLLTFELTRPVGNSPQTALIHGLDDSLLNVFNLYRPFLLGEDQDDGARLPGGGEAGMGWRTLVV